MFQKIARPFHAFMSPQAETLFSIRQATVQAWQPVQRSRSMTIPHFGIATSYALPTATRASYQRGDSGRLDLRGPTSAFTFRRGPAAHRPYACARTRTAWRLTPGACRRRGHGLDADLAGRRADDDT